MDDDNFLLRLQRIEIEQERHKISLLEREKCEVKLWEELNKINESITKVKTAIYTASFILLMQNMGLFEILKMMIH